ncbi:MAG: response regulator [Clostridia bacterium]
MYQVLIVDDEPIVKIALRSMLDWGSLGFHICGTASNGQEALEMAERMHPNLIICDLKMPVMDGIDLIRTAKDRSMNCEFLVISNYEDFNYVRTALVLGASDYILKVSISPEELTTQLQKIKEKLDQKQTHHQHRKQCRTIFSPSGTACCLAGIFHSQKLCLGRSGLDYRYRYRTSGFSRPV